jgi:hypothetical protein
MALIDLSDMVELDHDLSKLSPEDRRLVCRWAEDRIINAIAPLAVHLQREAPVVIESDPTLQAGRHAVGQLMRAVNEIRELAGVRVDTRWEAVISGLQRPEKSS